MDFLENLYFWNIKSFSQIFSLYVRCLGNTENINVNELRIVAQIGIGLS